VIRVVRATEIVPLPHAPAVVRGVVDVAGEIVPVVSARARLGLPERPLDITSQFALVRGRGRTLALIVDSCEGVREHGPGEMTACSQVSLDPAHFDGITVLEDGLMLVSDSERFLLPGEAQILEEALDSR
jgi:purine-binding chemotaxis protein CheW